MALIYKRSVLIANVMPFHLTQFFRIHSLLLIAGDFRYVWRWGKNIRRISEGLKNVHHANGIECKKAWRGWNAEICQRKLMLSQIFVVTCQSSLEWMVNGNLIVWHFSLRSTSFWHCLLRANEATADPGLLAIREIKIYDQPDFFFGKFHFTLCNPTLTISLNWITSSEWEAKCEKWVTLLV